jgi:hypothetical protein
VMPALGSTRGRRGPLPTVLGRPAPDAWTLLPWPGVAVIAFGAQAAAAAVRASRTNGFALVG